MLNMKAAAAALIMMGIQKENNDDDVDDNDDVNENDDDDRESDKLAWPDRQIDIRMDRWMHGWTDGQAYRCKDTSSCRDAMDKSKSLSGV